MLNNIMWKEYQKVVYHIPKKFGFNETVAIFNIIDTIVKKKVYNGKIYNKRELYDNFEYKYNSVKDRILEINNKGASIIFHQDCYRQDINIIKRLYVKLLNDLNIPIAFFTSVGYNGYNKPFTHIFRFMNDQFKENNSKINKKTSIVVGNNAGRININNNKKIDSSSCDRAFAHNIKVNFLTDSYFFINKKSEFWKWDSSLDIEMRKKYFEENQKIESPNIIKSLEMLPDADNYTIIITGPPGCGKTTLAKKICKKWNSLNYISDNDHLIDDMVDLRNITEIINKLNPNCSTVIDIVCNFKYILSIIKKSMEHKKPILIIEITMINQILRLMYNTSIQRGDPNRDIYDIESWNFYIKNYKTPDFTNIKCIKYVKFPLVIKLNDEIWFEYAI